jgi:hypothetical protein
MKRQSNEHHRRAHDVRHDDKVEAKRRMIRQQLGEIAAEVENAMRAENLRCPIQITVPTRHSLVTISGQSDVPPDEWSRMSAIIRAVLERKLGGKGFRSRPLSRAVAHSTTGSGVPD